VDPDRLADLLDRHAAALALYASQWTPAADDVVQEAFVRLIGAAPPPGRPLPWLYKVVRNLALDERRADARRRRREAGVAARIAEGESADLIAGEVAEAVERLDGETREVVVAHLWGGLTFAEIGELVGSSPSAAHRRYQAGLAALRKTLDQPCANHTT
jgi:RNA polymerase sigma-70 factor (ECF subfamily)